MEIGWERSPDEQPGYGPLLDRHSASGYLSDGRRFGASVRSERVVDQWLHGAPRPEVKTVWRWWVWAGERVEFKRGVEDDAETALYRAEVAIHEYVDGDLAWWTQSTRAEL